MFTLILSTLFYCVFCAENHLLDSYDVKGNLNTLKSLQVISRHGERTPYANSYPSDPNKEFLALGLSQLTQDGVIQMKNYGYAIKERYNGYLVRDYRKVLSRSSYIPRCVQTGYSMLSAIYTDSACKILNNNPDGACSQPVVTFSLSPESDGALYNSYVDDLHPLYGDTPTLGFDDQFLSNLLEDCRKGSGLQLESVYDALDLYDTLLCEKVHGKIIPPWVGTVYPRLEKLNEAFFAQMYRDFSQAIGGSLLKLLLNDLENPSKFLGTNITIDSFYYFTHDYQIISILGLLKIPRNSYAPSFGATILIEKHVYQDNSTFIKIYYLDSPNSKLQLLQVEGCSKIGCEFSQFKTIIIKALS